MRLSPADQTRLKILRDRQTGLRQFRAAAHGLLPALFAELKRALRARKVRPSSIVCVFVLRAALVFLAQAVHAFPAAPVAFAGLRRHEKTAIAHWYYENFPAISGAHAIVLFDPMLATGGSAEASIMNLKKRGADPRRIYFLGFLAAPEGIKRLTKHIPRRNIIVAAVDAGLDTRKFIVPGLGDFGDRYFGT